MYVVLALVGIDGGLYWLVSLGVLKVGLRSVGRKDLDIGVGSVRCPWLSAHIVARRISLPDGLLRMCPAKRSNDIFDPLDRKLRNALTYSLDFQLVPHLN